MTTSSPNPDAAIADTAALDLETALRRLEEVAARMDADDLKLEDGLRLFEEGVRLTRRCRDLLDEAQRRIVLIADDGGESPLPDAT